MQQNIDASSHQENVSKMYENLKSYTNLDTCQTFLGQWRKYLDGLSFK